MSNAITFHITIIEGRDLIAMDRKLLSRKKTCSDPYIELFYGGKSYGRTVVVEKDLNPIWNGKFTIEIGTADFMRAKEGRAEYKSLTLQIFDEDVVTAADFMGESIVELPLLQDSEKPQTQTSWYFVGVGSGKLSNKKASGEIQVKVSAIRGPDYPADNRAIANPPIEVGLSTNPEASSGQVTTQQPPLKQQPWTSWDSFQSSGYQRPPLKMQTASQYELSQQKITPTGRHRALIIGINYPGTNAELKGCANDAVNMKRLLVQAGFKDDSTHMIVLSDDESAVGNIAHGNMDAFMPTAVNVRRGFQWLVHNASEGDILFFHFSGHGHQMVDKKGFEADGYNETILPSDFRQSGQISDDEIWGTLVYPLPSGVRLTSVMDCCHSGTGLDLPLDYNLDTSQWDQDHNPSLSRGDVILFSGCEDAQTSADVQSKGMAGGAMTQCFLAALEENPRPTFADLIGTIRKQLKKRGFPQRPQLTSNQSFDVRNRVFMLTDDIEPNRNREIGRLKRSSIRLERSRGFDLMESMVEGVAGLTVTEETTD